jgi:hypothetical protein
MDGNSERGYLTVTVGALFGAVFMASLTLCASVGITHFANRNGRMEGGEVSLALFLPITLAVIGAWIGASAGCWIALGGADYARAALTGGLLFVLIPLTMYCAVWLIGSYMHINLDGLLALVVVMIPLPLLARRLSLIGYGIHDTPESSWKSPPW